MNILKNMKPTDKNIVNQLIKKQTPLPNNDYFVDLSTRLITEITQNKTSIVPLYKKLIYLSSAIAAVIAIGLFLLKEPISNKLNKQAVVLPPKNSKTIVNKKVQKQNNTIEYISESSINTPNKMNPSINPTPPSTTNTSFENIEKEAIYSYLLDGSDEIDEDQLSNLLSN